MAEGPATIVFLGPSLSRDTAAQILPAEYRPPARKGDIYALLASRVQRILLIDGIFHSGPSIWQREILAALDEGIEVFGASSMGALRAAELYPFGMVGCGTVFEWYRSGCLDGDDEVALRHAPDELGYRALSEPLVNIRATLRQAVRDGQLSLAEHNALLAAMKQTHYADRSYRALLAGSIVQAWSSARRGALAAYVASRAVDVKADDARGLLALCARTAICGDAQRAGPGDRRVDRRVDPWAAEFRYVALRYRRIGERGRTAPWSIVQRALRRPGPRWNRAIARATIAWCLADLARLRGVACPTAAVEDFASRWHRAHRVGDPADWAHPRGLTCREHGEILQHRALCTWLRAAGSSQLGVAWNRAAAVGVHRLLRTRRPLVPRADDSAVVAGWLAAHGIACPRGERARRLTAWGLGSAARRRTTARRLGIDPADFAAALDHRVAAEWLLATGLPALGRAADLETTAVLDAQFSLSASALRAIGGRP